MCKMGKGEIETFELKRRTAGGWQSQRCKKTGEASKGINQKEYFSAEQ